MTDDDFIGGFNGFPPEIEQQILQLRFVDARVLAGLAVGCGWATDFGKGVRFVAPDGTKIVLPLTAGLNAKVFRAHVNTIVRHRAPKAPLRSVVEGIIAHPKVKIDPSRVQVLRAAVEVGMAHPPAVEPAPSSGETEPAPVVTSRKVRIVREEPWSAHRNAKGETYPSEAVMERHWSNGTVDYACRWPGCEHTDESPNNVAKHNGAHKRGQGTSPQAAVDGLDPAWVTNPRRATRIRNLAREIDGALIAAKAAGIVADPAWLAQWIIDHRVDSLPTLGETPEELTPDQILDKIASLVDRGRGKVLREQVDTLQRQVDGFIDRLQEVVALAVTNENRAIRAEGSLQALRDMLNDDMTSATLTEPNKEQP